MARSHRFFPILHYLTLHITVHVSVQQTHCDKGYTLYSNAVMLLKTIVRSDFI